jgi:hypothetical protein
MNPTRQWIPIAGLLATMVAGGIGVVHLHGQSEARDLTQAAMAQVRTAQGEVLLQGPFMEPVAEDRDRERRARLAPSGSDADAVGEAEIELPDRGERTQEVEFKVRNLDPNVAITFVIDGVDVASATTDKRGRASVEMNVRMPAATASR